MPTKVYTGTISKRAQNQTPLVNMTSGADINGEIVHTWVVLNLCVDYASASSRTYRLYVTLHFGSNIKTITQTIMWPVNTTESEITLDWSGLTLSEANSITALQVGCAESGIYIDGAQTIMIPYNAAPTITNVTAPTSFTVSTTKTTSSNITITWSGASSGTGNTISGYQIQYQDSSNNTSWGSWYALKTVSSSSTSGSTSASLPSARNYRRFRIKTLGTVSGYDSTTYRVSSSVLRTSVPTTPSGVSVVPIEWEEGEVTFSWNSSSATGQTISYYIAEYRVQPAGGEYGSWISLPSTTQTSVTHTPTFSAGDTVQYRVRAYSSDGYFSSYSNSATMTVISKSGAYIGIENVAREIIKIYIGIDGIAREIDKIYIGVDGIAAQIY